MNVSDAFSKSSDLTEARDDFGAYAIALQDTFASYPNALMKKIAEIAEKSDVKFLSSKISKVSSKRCKLAEWK